VKSKKNHNIARYLNIPYNTTGYINMNSVNDYIFIQLVSQQVFCGLEKLKMELNFFRGWISKTAEVYFVLYLDCYV